MHKGRKEFASDIKSILHANLNQFGMSKRLQILDIGFDALTTKLQPDSETVKSKAAD
jgi:hypothetical protein